MKTRKIRMVISKKGRNSRTYLKIHKGGESTDSNKSSVGVQQKSAASSPKGASGASRRSPSRGRTPSKGASGASRRSPSRGRTPSKGASGTSRRSPSRGRTPSKGRVKVSPRGPSREVLKMWKKTLNEKYHSDAESGPVVIDEDIANRTGKGNDYLLDEYVPKPQNVDIRKLKRFRRRLQENIPQAPPIIVSPQGRNLVTTYTPTFDIVEHNSRMSVRGSPVATAPTLQMSPFHYPYDRPLPLSYLPKNGIKLTPEENKIKTHITLFPVTYDYLAYAIYDMLLRINKLNSYANVLVKGRLRDELIPNIRMTSIEVMQSRLFMSREDTERFMELVYIYTSEYNAIGPDPFNPRGVNITDIDVQTPIAKTPDPNSYMVKGYNTHPMFRRYPMTPEEEMELVNLSEKQPKIKGEDFALVYAHGSVSNELTPKMKFLANKYIRIIEFGNMSQGLSIKYRNFIIKLNYIMQSSFYNVMFDNTDDGQSTRDMAFKILCPYLIIDGISACNTKQTLNLTDITNDRYIEGEVDDMMIHENMKISYKTIRSNTTMGIFLPVNYNLDNSTQYLAKKELFKLYPGTTFFTRNTKLNLIETLLPMAIKRNRRINLFIVSCMVNYIYDDDLHNSMIGKPGYSNPAIRILNTGKMFLAKFIKMTNDFFLMFYQIFVGFFEEHTVGPDNRDIFSPYMNYVQDGNNDAVFKMGEKIIEFSNRIFQNFKRYSYTNIQTVHEIFSFAGINQGNISNDIIGDSRRLNNEWYYPYLNELIKVKIFLMTDFKELCSTKIVIVKKALEIINKNVVELRSMYGPGPFSDPEYTRSCDMLDSAAVYVKEALDYFTQLDILRVYILDGFFYDTDTNPDPDAFANYPKYVEMKKEYDETSVKKIYEELTANLDYDRYEGVNVGFKERAYKVSLLNPLPYGRFRKTSRYMYKTKVLPNYDEARRRRKTMKQKLYEDEGIGERAQKAKSSSAVSV